MKNNKGFTLLECLAVLTIIGILAPLMGRFMINFAKLSIPRSVYTAQSLVAKVIPMSNTCTLVEDTYYAKASGTDTLNIYTNSTCTTSFGSLNRLNNPSWFDENTYTDWWVYSYSGVLKVRLVKYTKGS